jgi:NAD(P)-dependent dehydrogenase (short-subunit alcohol dehydrogenase family)
MLRWMRDRIARATRSRGDAPLLHETAIVTGASSGIGAATAQALAAHGATVVLAARRAPLLDEQVEAITRAGGRAIAVPTDITDPRQIADLVHHTVTQLGRTDILVNCAGVGMPGPVPRLSLAKIHEHLATNLMGPILLTRAVLPAMVARRHGVIVSVASLASHLPIDPLYSATKFGLRGFSLALRRQLRGSGVSASLVSPGFIRTALNREIRRSLPGPEYVARHIVGLVLSPRRELIVPRFYQFDIWTERVVPWMMEWLLRRRMTEKPGSVNSVTDVQHIQRVSGMELAMHRPVEEEVLECVLRWSPSGR